MGCKWGRVGTRIQIYEAAEVRPRWAARSPQSQHGETDNQSHLKSFIVNLTPLFLSFRWGAGLRKQNNWESEERQLGNRNKDGANWALETHRGLGRGRGLREGWQDLCRPQVSRERWREVGSDSHRTTRGGQRTGKPRKDSVCALDQLTK